VKVDLAALINPTPRQRDAFAASLKYRFMLYGGAGGGGKSYFLRWWCLRELLRLRGITGKGGHRIGLFSMDYPTLTDRQISRIAIEFPDYLGVLKETRAEGYNFKLHAHLGGGTIALRNLDDPSKYKSAEFAGIAVEELTENDKATFDDLRFRMRWPGVERPCFVAATNPGGIGHAWVKQLWIDRDFPSELLPLASEFGFVSAKVQDNPHLTDQYYQDLLTLPEDKRKAYAEGDWNIFAGQYFPEWRDDVHVVEPFTIPSYWRTWRGGDWGGTSPAAFLWLATDPIGNTYVTDEVYVRGATIRDHSELIRPIDRNRGCTWGILDGACFGDESRDSLGKTIGDQYADAGVSWRKGVKGPGSRVAGWTRIHSLLAHRDSTPKLRVFSTCRNLIRTLPGLVHDKIRVEDVDSDGEDHAPDALRYALGPSEPVAVQDFSTMHPDDADAFRAGMRDERRPMQEAW
jgi:phage terminase large subunit